MSEHTSLLFPHWGQTLMEGMTEASLDALRERAKVEKLVSLLISCRAAMVASQLNGGQTNWSHMIAAIDEFMSP